MMSHLATRASQARVGLNQKMRCHLARVASLCVVLHFYVRFSRVHERELC